MEIPRVRGGTSVLGGRRRIEFDRIEGRRARKEQRQETSLLGENDRLFTLFMGGSIDWKKKRRVGAIARGVKGAIQVEGESGPSFRDGLQRGGAQSFFWRGPSRHFQKRIWPS